MNHETVPAEVSVLHAALPLGSQGGRVRLRLPNR